MFRVSTEPSEALTTTVLQNPEILYTPTLEVLILLGRDQTTVDKKYHKSTTCDMQDWAKVGTSQLGSRCLTGCKAGLWLVHNTENISCTSAIVSLYPALEVLLAEAQLDPVQCTRLLQPDFSFPTTVAR